MLKVAVINPPISNLNTMYAAVPRLTGWLRALGHRVDQIDLSLELFLRLYTRRGLERLFDAVDPARIVGDKEDVYINRDRYIRIIDDVIALTQGRDPALAHRIVRSNYLPEGPHFRVESPARRRAAFGPFNKIDHARHLATLMLQDLTDLFSQTISPLFSLHNYGEKLAESRDDFDEIEAELTRERNVFETAMLEVAAETLADDLDLVCFTCPFPGNLLSSLLLGRWLGENRPQAQRALGGGYPSTELRELSEPRVFDYVDYVVLDDGEIPLKQICARVAGDHDAPLQRTFVREDGRVVWRDDPCDTPRFREMPAPDYTGLRMDRYIQLIFSRNPVSRIQNEGPWLKLTAAHGCYWKKCTFCDIHLSYIGDFDPLPAQQVADQMDVMHEATGLSSFHFTDEAVPPSLFVKLALELLRRERSYQFWGNIRFDPGFTAERCRLLAAAGMIAVTGGIEVASESVLKKIDKGVSIPQVARVLQAFTEAKILTHAYLIYGFPGETVQDTINSLEILRQFACANILGSGFFHRFSATAHSPVGRNPELFGIGVDKSEHRGFARYVLNFRYNDPDELAYSERVYNMLQTAMYHYSCREYLDRDVRAWFGSHKMPATTLAPDYIERILATSPESDKQLRLCWLGGRPRWDRGLLTVSCEDGELYSARTPKWVFDNLVRCHPAHWIDATPPRLREFDRDDWFGPLRSKGLVLV